MHPWRGRLHAEHMLERAGEPSETMIVARELPPMGIGVKIRHNVSIEADNRWTARPPPAPAGESGRVARAAQRVLVPP